MGLLTVVCVLSVAGMTFVLSRPQATFVPPPFEENAVDGTPSAVPAELGYGSLDATAYTVALCGMPDVEDGALHLWFTNPESNAVWLKVRVYAADGTLLGESGLLTPGQYLETLPLEPCPAPGTSLSLKVMAYEPDTYRSAGAVTLNLSLRGQ